MDLAGRRLLERPAGRGSGAEGVGPLLEEIGLPEKVQNCPKPTSPNPDLYQKMCIFLFHHEGAVELEPILKRENASKWHCSGRHPSSEPPERAGWVGTDKRGLSSAIPIQKMIRQTPFMARNERVTAITQKISGGLWKPPL